MQIDEIKDEFATDEFIANNQYFYDRYIHFRIHGHSQHSAFNRAFGQQYLPDNLKAMYDRFEQIESTEYYQINFERRLKSIPVDKLWNDRMSVHELLSLARNPANKDSTRLAAVKELNVIVGITVETDSGKTKAVRALADFYKNESQPSQPASSSAQSETKDQQDSTQDTKQPENSEGAASN